jgi:hypothetical protein
VNDETITFGVGLATAIASALGTNLASCATHRRAGRRPGALGAHARDELGLAEQRLARPLQAAWVSTPFFAAGASLPLIAVAARPPDCEFWRAWW